MKRRPDACLLAALIVASTGAATAQEELDTRLSGYFEHQYSLSRTNSDWRHVDYDRLRGEFDVRTRQGSRASAAVVYQLYRGDTRIDPGDFLPQGIVTAGADSLGLRLEDRHYLNHAYVVIRASPAVEISAGKQYLTWGAAAVFNPTELFRPKNALEPSYDREGVGAVSVRIELGPLSDILVALVPEGGVEESGKVIRLRHHIAGFDVSGLAAVKPDTPFGSLSETALKRYVVGGDMTGELLGLGIWAEGAYSEREGKEWIELTVGGNHTFVDGTSVLAEAFFDGRGKAGAPYAAQAWMERLLGDRRTLGRWTAFGMVRRPVGRFWNIGISLIASPGDRSFVAVPAVSWSFADNIDLLINGLWYAGDDGDEFGFDQLGGFVRGRIYF